MASQFSRRLLIAFIVFVVFVLSDVALLGWLFFRSLSQREIEKVLLETRGEAEQLAELLEDRVAREGVDLYTAVTLVSETRTYFDTVGEKRKIVQDVQILDREGRLVMRNQTETEIFLEQRQGVEVGSGEVPPRGSPEPAIERFETELSAEEMRLIEVPIGDYGLLQIGISSTELAQRVEVLRRDLLQVSGAVGGVTFLLIFFASLAMWWLLVRGRRLEEQAADAERMAYVGTLASGLAHEIRNPLNSLNLNMQMLTEDLGDSAADRSNRRLLAITRSELSRLERLVTDFLSYAKPRRVDLDRVAPRTLLERVAAVLAGEVRRRGARLAIEDRSAGARLEVDAAQIKQLLLNLTQNALAATEESGRRPMVKLLAYRHGDRVVLEVTDNGIGIPPEEQGHIFEVFHSSKKGGTGLGLAIVDRIARAHGGRVEVRSTPGVGTSFCAFLPIAEGSEEPAHEPVPASKPA